MSAARCLAVLVVEDDEDIRDAVTTALEAEGFHVFRAENGAAALEMLKTMPHPSLILADLMMPVMDGPSLIAALRLDDQFASLPVVIVSALDANSPQGYRRIKKPIDLDDLLQIVSEFCLRLT
jgi:CheY-like chemotaxis protein